MEVERDRFGIGLAWYQLPHREDAPRRTALNELIVRIDSKNRIVLPEEVRQQLGVGPSDSITFVLHEDGRIEVRRTDSRSGPRYRLIPVPEHAPTASDR